MKEEWCLFQTSSAVNHVNQVIRGTREILIDSYGLPFIMKGLPFIMKGLPFIMKGLPFIMKGLPFIMKGLPFIMKGLPFIMKGVGDCVLVGHEITHFVSTIITANYFW